MFIQRIKMEKQWAGWLRWMKTVFEHGKTNEIWKNMELEKGLILHSRDSLIENYLIRTIRK